MKTLKRHEKDFWERYDPPKEWSKTEIACPECGEELEVNNFIVLASNPPQYRVRCCKCGYIGSIH